MRLAVPLSIAASILLFPMIQPASAKSGAKSGIHPACVGQRSDLAGKRRCTCAMETGGKINRNGHGWHYLNRYNYIACLTKNGYM